MRSPFRAIAIWRRQLLLWLYPERAWGNGHPAYPVESPAIGASRPKELRR